MLPARKHDVVVAQARRAAAAPPCAGCRDRSGRRRTSASRWRAPTRPRAPSARNRSAVSSFCAAIRSICRSTRADERPQAAIAAKALVAQPAVDDRHPRAVPLGGRDQIRPQLQLGQHQQRRPHAPHRGGRRPTEIERAVEHRAVGVLACAPGRSRSWSSSRRRSPTPAAAAQLGDRRRQQIHLADAHRVQPDARPIAVAPRHAAQAASRANPSRCLPCRTADQTIHGDATTSSAR